MSPALHAGTRLNFPHLTFQIDNLTGVALVNPSASEASVTLTAYGRDGKPLAGKEVHNPIEFTIPAHQQVAKVVSSLLGPGIDPGTVAWFQVVSDTDGLTGFFLTLNSANTLLEGAEPPPPARRLVFNHVRLSGSSTELSLANPGDTGAEVELELRNRSGGVEGSKKLTVAAHGVERVEVGQLFELTTAPAAAYLTVDSSADLVGFELVRTPGGDAIGLNARRAVDQLNTLSFLGFSALGAFQSQLGVVNYTTEPVILTISATKSDGTLFGAGSVRDNPVTRTLASGGALLEDVASMFGFTGEETVEGSITVKATSPAVNGYLLSRNTRTGAAAAVTTAAQGRTRALLSHIATGASFSTRIQVFNPGTLTANIRIVALASDGSVLGGFDGALQPQERLSRVLGRDLIAEAVNQLGGMVWVRSDLPVYIAWSLATESSWTQIGPQEAPESYRPDSGLASLKMAPPLAIVSPKRTQRFQVQGGGTSLSWKVNGVPGGDGKMGTITADGVYTAPGSPPSGRNAVAITAEGTRQSAGATVDVLDKTTLLSDFRVAQSVAYLGTLGRVYAAEFAALGAFGPFPPGAAAPAGAPPSAPVSGNSQVVEVSPLLVKTTVATFNNENVAKILAFHAIDGKDYLLVAAQTSGRLLRLDPSTRVVKELVTGLSEPSALVLDPVSGDLLIAEKDRITTVARGVLEADLTAQAPEPAVLLPNAVAVGIPVSAGSLAIDRCTQKVYYTVATEGTLREYDPSTGATGTVISGLESPGAILGIYRAGVTCPDALHILLAERGTGRILLVVPAERSFTTWLSASGANDLVFLPRGNPYINREGIFGTENLESGGTIFVVPFSEIYDGQVPANPPEPDTEPKIDLAVTASALPATVLGGDTLALTAIVDNSGPADATGVILTAKLPAGTTFGTATASRGTCTAAAGKVTCVIGALAKDANATLSVKVAVDNVASALPLAATFTVTGTETDTASANDTVTRQTTAVPAPAAGLQFSDVPATVAAGQTFSVSVEARTRFNLPAVGYRGTLRFSSSDTQATLPPDYTFTAADAGAHTFAAGVTLRALGTLIVSVQDTVEPLSTSRPVRVTAAPAGSLNLSGLPANVIAGTPATATVTVVDAQGKVASGYTGTVVFTSSDATATVPAAYTFTAADAGTHTWNGGVVLRLAGTQTVTASDKVDPSITATRSVVVDAGAPSTVGITGIPPAIQAGAPATVTVAIQDGSGNGLPTFTGTVHFSSSDPIAVLPADYTFVPADNGKKTFTNAITLKTSGTQTVTVAGSGTAVPLSTAPVSVVGGTWTVKVSAGAATTLALTGLPTSIASGAAATATVSLKDTFGNLAPSYTGTVRFTSNDPAATLPANYTYTAADGGTHTWNNGVTLRTSGSRTVTATDVANGSLSASAAVTVTSTSVTLAVTAPAAATSGKPVTVTVAAKDATGAVVTGYRGTIRFSSSDPTASFPANYTFTSADAGSKTFGLSVTLRTLGSQSLTATDTVDSTITGTASILVAGTASRIELTGLPSGVVAGVGATVTVTARDASGAVAAGYTGTVHFSSTDAQGVVPADATFTGADAGVKTFTAGVVLKTAGSRTLTVTDAVAAFAASQTTTVSPAGAGRLELSGLPASLLPGGSATPTVTARDPFGNIATGYTGRVRFSSSDPSASLAPDYTFTLVDAGIKSFPSGVRLRSTGSQSVTVTDVAAGFSASQTITVASGGTATQLTVSGLANPIGAGVAGSVTVTAKDAGGATVTNYTGTVRFTSSDTSATLPADYTFTGADAGTHTFTGGVTLRTVGSQSVTATDTVSGSVTGSQTVSVQPLVSFALASSSGAESVTSPVIDVNLSTAAATTVTVNYAVTGGTATGGGVDYTLASGTLTFTSGQTTLPIPLAVVDDLATESDETVVITLSSPSGAILGTTTSHTYTILDNDNANTITLTPPNLSISALSSGTITVTISPAAGPSGVVVNLSSPVTVTVTVTNPATAVISTSATTVGTSSVTFTNVTTTSVGTIYVQGLALGTTTLTATATGYNSGTSNVTVDPSGFFIYTPGSFSTTTFSADTSITVYAAVLNPTTLNFANYGTVRAGVTANVPVTSSNTSVGTITTSPVVLGGNVSFNTTAFHPLAAGTSTVALGTPTGGNFSTASSQQSITATVSAPTITIANYNPGVDLQQHSGASLQVAAPSPVDVTFTSSNSAVAVLSTSTTAAGTASVTVTGVSGTLITLTLVVQGIGLGTATLTASAPGYQTATATITVDPSGFVILSPGSITTTTMAANTGVGVYSARLTPGTLLYSTAMSVRAGLTVTVPVTSSNTAVGTITTSPLTFTAPNLTVNTEFDPVGVGTSTISVGTPSTGGFSTPNNFRQITATVN